MAEEWKYWDNDHHEWKYIDPEYLNYCDSSEIHFTPSSAEVKYNEVSDTLPAKLPNLTIHDLLDEGFRELNRFESAKDLSYIRNTTIKKVRSDGNTNECKQKTRILAGFERSNDEPSLSLPRFGLTESRKLRRIVPGRFPGGTGISQKLSKVPSAKESNGDTGERPERLESPRRLAKQTLSPADIPPTVYHVPNPIATTKYYLRNRIGYSIKPIKGSADRVPSQLSSRRCLVVSSKVAQHMKLATQMFSGPPMVESLPVYMIGYDEPRPPEMKSSKTKRVSFNLDHEYDKLNQYQQRAIGSPGYNRLAEHQYGSRAQEPMTCKNILHSEAPHELTNINIDFESAMASRKDGKNTYRKYSNVKKWESNLREYKSERKKNQPNQQLQELLDEFDQEVSAATETQETSAKHHNRPLPPPPSPTVKCT